MHALQGIVTTPVQAPADPHHVGKLISKIHGALVRWLEIDRHHAQKVGGPLFLRAQIMTMAMAPDPEGADLGRFDFDYYDGRIRLGADLLRAWSQLRGAIGPQRWEEVIRLFLLHEGHHIDQGMSYRSRDIGRAAVALEAMDYDADVASIEGCLEWRRHRAPAALSRQGEMGALGAILDNLLAGLTLFDDLPQAAPIYKPIYKMKERRLRRHLIWHFQRARARAAAPHLAAERLQLFRRVMVEFPGLVTAQERRGNHLVSFVDLERLHQEHEPELVIYDGHRLYRCPDSRFCGDLLAGLRSGEVERVSRVFHRLFEQHPYLVPT